MFYEGKTLSFHDFVRAGWGGTGLAFLLISGGSGLTPPAARPRPSLPLGRERRRYAAPLGIQFAPLGIGFSSRVWGNANTVSHFRAQREKNNPVSGPVWDFLPGRQALQCVQNPPNSPQIEALFFPYSFSFLIYLLSPRQAVASARCAPIGEAVAVCGGAGGGRWPPP